MNEVIHHECQSCSLKVAENLEAKGNYIQKCFKKRRQVSIKKYYRAQLYAQVKEKLNL